MCKIFTISIVHLDTLFQELYCLLEIPPILIDFGQLMESFIKRRFCAQLSQSFKIWAIPLDEFFKDSCSFFPIIDMEIGKA
jgi:hypothetical protein